MVLVFYIFFILVIRERYQFSRE